MFDVGYVGISLKTSIYLLGIPKANQAYIKSPFLAGYESASICKYLALLFFSSGSIRDKEHCVPGPEVRQYLPNLIENN